MPVDWHGTMDSSDSSWQILFQPRFAFFFTLPVSMRPPRVLTRSFTLMPATSTANDSVQLLGFGLHCSLTHRLRPVPGFCSSGQSFALRFFFPRNPASFRFPVAGDTLAFG